jgi:hypothetical protein
MSSPWLYALTVGPLGLYLWTLALWHSFRYPRVVSGLADYVLLSIGIGGVLAFGPFGQTVTRALFGHHPDLLDWMAVVSGLGLVASLGARRSLFRAVVYHVDAATLMGALDEVLHGVDGRFQRTLNGFEDRESGRGIVVDATGWLRSAVVEAYGRGAETLIQDVRPRLRERLRRVAVGPSRVAPVLYGLSLVVMTAPLVGMFLAQPRAREALRVLLERLRGV